MCCSKSPNDRDVSSEIKVNAKSKILATPTAEPQPGVGDPLWCGDWSLSLLNLYQHKAHGAVRHKQHRESYFKTEHSTMLFYTLRRAVSSLLNMQSA